jgi:hypothetical protein
MDKDQGNTPPPPVGQPYGAAAGAMAVGHRVQQYGEAMASWHKRVGPSVNPRVVAHKAALTFSELCVAAGKARDVEWQAQYRAAIAAAGLAPVPLCYADTDKDGNCHLCAAAGGCVPHGGPLIGTGEPQYAAAPCGPVGDPL